MTTNAHPLLCVRCYRTTDEGFPIRDKEAEVIYRGNSLCLNHFEEEVEKR